MTISEMLSQSGVLTLLGMGVVFSFLIIMILAMYLLHVILHALKMDQDKKEDTTKSVSAPSANTDTNAVVAAIAAAVHEK
jgi:oxaloacetate decarboxylase gamma subunit